MVGASVLADPPPRFSAADAARIAAETFVRPLDVLDDEQLPERAAAVGERLRAAIDDVLKIRPPLVFTDERAGLLVAAIDAVL